MTRNGTSQLLHRKERQINLRLERQDVRRKDEAANEARFGENLALDRAGTNVDDIDAIEGQRTYVVRGETITHEPQFIEPRNELAVAPAKRGEPRKPQRRLTGIEWMLSKAMLTDLQAQALALYGVDYRLATVEVGLRSGLDFTVRGGGGAIDQKVPKTVLDARARLNDAQKLALHSQSEIIVCCNMIAGQQLTPREAAEGLWRHQARMEVTTSIAGSLLARHYGLGVDATSATRA